MIESVNIGWWVKRWSEFHPAKPAIMFEGRQLSYLELQRRVNRTTRWIQSRGVEKGDRVAVMLKNCPEFLEVYLACAWLGVLFVPVNFRLVGSELNYILNHARPALFLFGSDQIEKIKELNLPSSNPRMQLSCLGVESEFREYNAEVAAIEEQEASSINTTNIMNTMDVPGQEEPQVIMYTSGTTGQPKGAVLPYGKTIFNCLNADIFFKLQFDDVMLIVLPLFHSGGLFIQASPILCKGATMVIHPRFDPLRTYRDIEHFKVTKFLGVPTVYRGLLDVNNEKKGDLSSLKVCAIGGEKTTPEFLAQCKESGFSLRQIMGQTETSILLWASEEDSLRKPRTVGKPVFHGELCLVDKEGCPVNPGEVGEIVVRGAITMTEYWLDPPQTEEAMGDGWLHTGDLARMDEEGFFYLVDRAKDMYISGGENVYPAEVERVLREHPGIDDIAIVGVPDETWGEVGHAFIIPRTGSTLCFEDLLSFCEKRLARYKRPKHITFCQDFPRTSMGKVQKWQLLQEDGERR